MSISSALQSAVSGLTANSRLLETASGNLANQLTAGYAARSATLGAAPGGSGGVRIVSVDRATDLELTGLRREAEGEAARQGILSAAAAAFASAIGEVGSADSLMARYQKFNTTFLALADTPESSPRMQAVLAAAKDLAGGLQSASDQVRRIREGTDADIARDVRQVNEALRRIAELNRQIQVLDASGRDSGALKDERERQIDVVSAVLPIREVWRDDGRVELRTAEGLTLVDRTARQLEFTKTPVITPEMGYSGGTGALSGLTLDGIDIAPGSGHPQALSDGALFARFRLRDDLAPEFQAQLDGLAADLIQRSQLGALDPSLPPGAPGLFTDEGLAFDPARLAGVSGRIGLSASVDPGAGGDPMRLRDGLGSTAPGPAGNDGVLRAYLAALGERRDAGGVPGLSGSLDLGATIAALMEQRSTLRVAGEAELTLLENSRAFLAAEEGRSRAVNEDQEMQRLIRLEQAYAANAMVIQVASRMLDQLTEL